METIITKAPLRVSFAGGGTDIEPYCSEYGGIVLNAAIKLYAQAFYPSESVVPSEMEQIIYDYLDTGAMVKLTNGAPQMSGLGGSAACFVAGIKAVRPDLGKEEIAKLAFYLERNVMGVAGGKQDQYTSAYGGLNYMEFHHDGVNIERLKTPQRLEELLLLVYMGKRMEMGDDIITDQMIRLNLKSFHRQKAIAVAMKEALGIANLVAFGKLLNEAWYEKLNYSPYISTPEINAFYTEAKIAGAIGGKLTGAGGGGYMLLMEHPNKPKAVRDYLTHRKIPYHNVKFDTEGVCVRNLLEQ